MEIKILGKESTKRNYLLDIIKAAIFELGFDLKIICIEEEVMFKNYNIKQTPALIINERIIFEGHVPRITEIKNVIKKFMQNN